MPEKMEILTYLEKYYELNENGVTNYIILEKQSYKVHSKKAKKAYVNLQKILKKHLIDKELLKQLNINEEIIEVKKTAKKQVKEIRNIDEYLLSKGYVISKRYTTNKNDNKDKKLLLTI